MKLFSAAGPEDLSVPYGAPLYAYNFVGFTDLVSYNANSGYLNVPYLNRGFSMRNYMSTCALPLRDIFDEYPDGGGWLALGVMVEPTPGQAFPNSSSSWFGFSPGSVGTMYTLPSYSRHQMFNLDGKGVRQCIELRYNLSTGEWRIYNNGIKRAEGVTKLPFNREWFFLLGAYDTSGSGGYTLLTDYYWGVTDGPDEILGNFKIAKLTSKQTTLPGNAVVQDYNQSIVTGDHSIEFDTSPLEGKIVAGVVENIRAASRGPTAAISASRRLNGEDGEANKAADIPIAFPTNFSQSLGAKRIGPKPTAYAVGTPLNEFKVNLSVVDN